MTFDRRRGVNVTFARVERVKVTFHLGAKSNVTIARVGGAIVTMGLGRRSNVTLARVRSRLQGAYASTALAPERRPPPTLEPPALPLNAARRPAQATGVLSQRPQAASVKGQLRPTSKPPAILSS